MSLVQTLIFGLAQGGIYSLMALAIGIIYSTTRIINFCHADIIMFGAMVAYWMVGVQHVPYGPGLLIAIAVNILLGILTYKFCVERLGDLAANNNWMITLFGWGIIIKNGARMLFGSDNNVFPYLFDGKTISIGNANIMIHELVMIGASIAIGIVYDYVCRKTKFGRALRAVSYRPQTSKLMGIDSQKIVLVCFALSAALASFAGALIAPITFASYNMTLTLGLKGYAAALIGGIGNTTGAFVGGLLLGLIECIVTIFLPAGIKDAISFIIMILVIIFLPGGILSASIFTHGKTTTEKV